MPHTAAAPRMCLNSLLLDVYMLLIVSHTSRLVMPPRQDVSVSVENIEAGVGEQTLNRLVVQLVQRKNDVFVEESCCGGGGGRVN